MVSWAEAWRAVARAVGREAAVRRGRVALRAGRVTDLRLRPGRLTARVQGSRATPLLVEVGVGVLPDAEWETVLELLAGTARHTARLLVGQAPEGLLEEAAAAGVALLPRRAEIDTRCGCGDRSRLCAHGAAAWEAFAERLTDVPLDLLALRGRSRERLLRDAQQRRAGPAADTGLPLDALEAVGWTAPRAALDAVPVPRSRAPATPAPSLRLAGDPPGWAGATSALDLLARSVAAAAERAALLTP